MVQSVIVKAGFWFPKVQRRADALIYASVIVHIDTRVQVCRADPLTAESLGEKVTGCVSPGTTAMCDQKYLIPQI